MAQKILMRRGNKSQLPVLQEAEMGFATDTKEVFMGTATGNLQIAASTTMHTNGYVVELDRWGIQPGSFGKPPYTEIEWTTAYNNLLGFNAAFSFAKDNGYNRILVPKGVYSFCYTNLNGGPRPVDMVGIPLKLFSNQTLDLNGSTFEVMYDSITKNPYDKSPGTTPAWKLSGKLINLDGCFNTHVTNGTIIGDIPNRSFSDGGSGFESEQGMEQTAAFSMDRGAKYCSLSYLDISMFMGDAIRIGAYPINQGTWNVSGIGNNTLSPGYLGNDGNVTAVNGAYLSPKYTIVPSEHKVIQMRTNGGYTRIPAIKGPYFEYVFLNSSNVVIARKKAVYLQTVTVPSNASYLQMQFTNEAVGLTSLVIDYAITQPQASHIHIHHCEIHNNHRGGISGGADFTLIEYNRIYHNGLDSSLGVPLFPDTTRYCINFEDSYCNELIIRSNLLFSGFNGLLLGAYNITVTGNILSEFGSGVLLYNNAKALIEDNVFYYAGSLGLMDNVSTQERVVMFKNNHVLGASLTVQPTGKTRVHIVDNKLSPDSVTLVGDVFVSGNRFNSPMENKDTSGTFTLRTTHCTDNTFENVKVNVQGYDARSLVGANTYKACAVSTNSSVNETAYADSLFVDCSIEQLQVLDKTKNSTITFTSCQFHDSRIRVANMYQNDTTNSTTITVKLVRSKVKMGDTASRVFIGFSDNVTSYPAGTSPRVYEGHFIDCEFENATTSNTVRYIFKASSENDTDNALVKKVVMEQCSLDFGKFKVFGDVAANTGVLKNMNYLNSSIPPTFVSGKLEAYNEVFTPAGTVYPSSLTPKVGACWFNTATGKPYWWTGTAWVDATGTAL